MFVFHYKVCICSYVIIRVSVCVYAFVHLAQIRAYVHTSWMECSQRNHLNTLLLDTKVSISVCHESFCMFLIIGFLLFLVSYV